MLHKMDTHQAADVSSQEEAQQLFAPQNSSCALILTPGRILVFSLHFHSVFLHEASMNVCEINIGIKAAVKSFWERVISVYISAVALPTVGLFSYRWFSWTLEA